ncbi:MAG: HEPN domain-containing protein [Pseudanabaena sp. ELA607]|jgi:uncharacterized protein (UPF0332 family)
MYQKFNWTLYLALAEQLLKDALSEQQPKTDNKIDEAYYRSAISRAYYAAFCVTRNYLKERLYKTIPRKDPHIFVANELSNNRSTRRIAAVFISLRDYRNIADYDDKAPAGLANIAKQSTQNSQLVIDLINRL